MGVVALVGCVGPVVGGQREKSEGSLRPLGIESPPVGNIPLPLSLVTFTTLTKLIEGVRKQRNEGGNKMRRFHTLFWS